MEPEKEKGEVATKDTNATVGDRVEPVVRVYFVNDPEGDGITTFTDKQKCEEFAKECIEDYLDEGWNEEVTNVIMGEVTHRAEAIVIIKRPPDEELDENGCDVEGNDWNNDFDSILDYEMKPIKGP